MKKISISELKSTYHDWTIHKSKRGYKYGVFASDVFEFLAEKNIATYVCEPKPNQPKTVKCPVCVNSSGYMPFFGRSSQLCKDCNGTGNIKYSKYKAIKEEYGDLLNNIQDEQE